MQIKAKEIHFNKKPETIKIQIQQQQLQPKTIHLHERINTFT